MPEPRVCEPGGGGLILPLFGDDEQSWPNGLRAVLYFLALSWCFLGVAVIADIFMAAIEEITSKRRVCSLQNGKKVVLKVWNSTVANLTLMALGSSAPEILLSVIEILSNSYYSGAMGPSTIVGSAAFNLLVIIAICVYVIPPGESRTIRQLGPFIVTAVGSTFAYLWLVVILALISPDVVEVWEGVVTFLFFPVFVVLAFLADIGMLGCGRHTDEHTEEVQRKAQEAGFDLTQREAKLLAAHASEQHNELKSRAQHRTDVATGSNKSVKDGDLQVCFPCVQYAYGEDAETFFCEVAKFGNLAPECRVGLELVTKDGSLQAGVHYTKRHIFLELQAEDESDVIEIVKPKGATLPCMEKRFFELHIVRAVLLKKDPEVGKYAPLLAEEIEQEGAKPPNLLTNREGLNWVATITIQEAIGHHGTLAFENVDHHVIMGDGDQTLDILVKRSSGTLGEARCSYKTESNSAIEHYDFIPVEGMLTFEEGVLERTIQVTIKGNQQWETKESFFVKLYDGEADNQDGEVLEEQLSTCEVSVSHASSPHGVATQVMAYLDHAVNIHSVQQGNAHWKENLWKSLIPEDDDEDGVFTVSAIAIHVVSFPWKFMFALVPPPNYCGGWLCFFVALAAIGLLTAVIGDLASLLGCVVGVEDAITAISIVALGTSLPDTFASTAAACDDATADNAIGNVTGSNAVNVFLGLGMPWMIAALHWQANGASDEWKSKYPIQSQDWPDGAFVVIAGDLVYSVIIFTVCSVSSLSIILFRRKAFQAELGGPTGVKIMTSVFFVGLWIYYLLCASWKVKAGDVSFASMLGVAILGYAMVCTFVVVLTMIMHIVDKRMNHRKEELHKLLHRASREGLENLGPFEGTIVEMRQQVQALSTTMSGLEAVVRRGAPGNAERQKQVDKARLTEAGQAGIDKPTGTDSTGIFSVTASSCCPHTSIQVASSTVRQSLSRKKSLDKE